MPNSKVMSGQPILDLKPRPGPKSKPVAHRRSQSFLSPCKRLQQSHTQEFKLSVLSWWQHGKISSTNSPTSALQPPSARDVSQCYKVSISTLRGWKHNESLILNSKKYASSYVGIQKTASEGRKAKWPRMEETLYAAYRIRREERKPVRHGWLRCQSMLAFKNSYPERRPEEFSFLTAWFQGFLSRHRIRLHFTTNKSQKIPEEYLESILGWLQFNQRNSQIRAQDQARVVGRYLLDSICNMDKTPLPFEYLDGETYANKGSHTVQVKATASGWDKQQATIVLCICGSGKNRLKPFIIFKGKESYTGNRAQYYQRKNEGRKWLSMTSG